jgi:hypothetical protein
MIEIATATVGPFQAVEQQLKHLNKKCSKKFGESPSITARDWAKWSQGPTTQKFEF